MLNEELLSAEEKKIMQLELAIKKFKEYDGKRKLYIENLTNRISNLEDALKSRDELIAKIEDGGLVEELESLRESNKKLRHDISHLNKLLYISSHYDDIKDIENPSDLARALSLKETNKALRKKMKSLKDNYDTIISQR